MVVVTLMVVMMVMGGGGAELAEGGDGGFGDEGGEGGGDGGGAGLELKVYVQSSSLLRPPQNLHFKVHKVLHLPRICPSRLQALQSFDTTKSSLQGLQGQQKHLRLPHKSAPQGPQSTAHATKSTHETCTSRFTKCCACNEICTSRFTSRSPWRFALSALPQTTSKCQSAAFA